MRGDGRHCASSTRSSQEMMGEYSLAQVDLLLGLAVVRLGRHDGGCVIAVVSMWCIGLLGL